MNGFTATGHEGGDQGLDDPFDEFWALFAVELDEYLTAVETILAASPVDTGRVDELFRAFHSVKGGSAALALRCIETVAHAAEDVLHLVRAGRRTLTPDLVSALLEAVDEMRRLQDTAMATRQDQPVNEAVVRRLKAHLADPAADVPSVTPAVPPGTSPLPPPAPPPAVEPPAPASAVSVLDIGAEEVLAIQDAVLGLIGVIDGDVTDAAAVLEDAAAQAGLDGVVVAARRLAAGDGDPRWRWLDLITRLRGAEMGSGGALGVFALTAALEFPFAELLLEHAGTLKSRPGDPAGWLHAARLLAGMELDTAAELAEFVAARRLLGEDAGPVDEVADIFALIGIALTSGMDMPFDEITALRDQCFAGAGIGVAGGGALPLTLTDMARPWPPDVLERLGSVIAAGQGVVLILLDLERDTHAVDMVTETVFARTALHNRSRLDLGAGLFEYLVVLDAGETALSLARHLAGADPDRRCLRSLRPAGPGGAAGPEQVEGAEHDAPGPSLADIAAGAAAPSAAMAPVAVPSVPIAPVPITPVPAEPVPAAPSAPAAGTAPRAADAVVRVPSVAIDSFMDQIGELRLGLTALGLLLDGKAAGPGGGRQGAGRMVQDTMRRLDRTVRSLYDGALSLRVVPIGTLFSRLMRPIRDTAVAVGKEVTLVTAGEDVRIDKAMIEMLVDPLTHIVRNSVDHGIEHPDRRAAAGKPREGTIRIRARQGTSHAVIEVEDDGAGIDTARVRDKAVAKGLIPAAEAAGLSEDEATRLILLPGFSTRDEVTATSGRGVGMDIVVNAIKKLGGHLTIASRPGAGTRMVIEFPVSAAMQRVVAITLRGQTVAVQERVVREVVEVPASHLQPVGRRMALSLRGRFLPVVDCAALLGLGEPAPLDGGKVLVAVVDTGETELGLRIESQPVRREVFFKQMHPLIERNPLISGTAVIGTGGIMFALDTQALIALAVEQGVVERGAGDRLGGEEGERPCFAG
ncbi:chemotaxis protein histidine kinase CheA [Azospirillum fermentarium]|uniref:chemotaxis protein CheA n=1 Tax=Azospirillum fermentarium TaxID=1233114 RepID=UPI002227D48D|nr:ATP-binding protein [Azospirillum fermentarium]MCW2249219.1 chemotaxis protein histidine kinase CheA [Azospirillum fermentarium]